MPTYRSRGVDIRFCPTTEERFDAFLTKENGLSFAVGIPALGQLHSGTVMKIIAPEDAIAVPICLVSLKSTKAPADAALERWLMNELMLMGTDPVKRFAAAAAAARAKS